MVLKYFILSFLFSICFRKCLWYLQLDYEFYQYRTPVTGIRTLAKNIEKKDFNFLKGG